MCRSWDGVGDGKGVLRGARPEGRESDENKPLHAKVSAINIVTNRERKLCGENTEGSGTDRGLYGRMRIALFLSHFSGGSVSYEPVEMLGNACI